MFRTFASLVALSLAAPLAAQSAPAHPAESPLPPTRAAEYPGTMVIEVDARDTASRAFTTRQAIPLAPDTRDLVLVYPKWLPGNHAPSGQIQRVSRLSFASDAGPVAWERVTGEPYAFRLALPAGATQVSAEITYASPFPGQGWRVLMTDAMLNVQWEKMTLYPAGYDVGLLRVKPSVLLPEGWVAAGALDGAQVAGGRVSYAETDYATLVDSPLFAGKHHRRWELGHSVDLEAFGDEAKNLEADEEAIGAGRALVEEALATFGAKHFDHYDFLLALTDQLGGIGLEHHRSSENTQTTDDLSDFAGNTYDNSLLPHEFVHSWNGKFRRPAGLTAPDYHTPLDARLLWVYEGQTSFWDWVLAARSGFMPKDQVLGFLAERAAYYSTQPGREWRSVEDSTFDPMLGYSADRPFPSLSRNRDYYREAGLVWLEADQIIRQGTRGRRGLDDFAKIFFGMRDGEWDVLPYDRSDIVAALNEVYPHDWDAFLGSRMGEAGQPAPLAGIELGGYRLVWRDVPNPYTRQARSGGKGDFSGSLGIAVAADGKVSGTAWGSVAFDAGLMPDTRIVAVDGMAFTQDRLAQALRDAQESKVAPRLIVRRGDRFETLDLPYFEGVRFAWLERVGAKEQGLDLLLSPRRK
ncbi:M61 family metallopeptidase [Qipengyuania zhejiangensis]|uniref:M61 family metallopeptidase n=1 Tax=Qipengyuania zhejiangensis TaxID=3077782 RepID=UPI002D787B42|nr:peptidase M61 [Qipengyuania sp. Z2]